MFNPSSIKSPEVTKEAPLPKRVEFPPQSLLETGVEFSVKIDSDSFEYWAMKGLERFTTSEPKFTFDKKAQEQKRAHRRESLQATINAVSRLPSELVFKPGITLITGENGLGKSTLGRAIHFAARVAVFAATNPARDIEYARDLLLDIETANRGSQSQELQSAGLAPFLARSMQVDLNCEVSHYFDLAEEFGRKQTWAKDSISGTTRYDNTGRDISSSGKEYLDGMSHRQTADSIFEAIEIETKRQAQRAPKQRRGVEGPQTYFIDEPEVGMSPARHRKLASELLEITIDESITIVPTNSIVLIDDPTLPRIALEKPEKGIHTLI